MEPIYIERDETGAVKGVYANLQEGYAEEMTYPDNPEVKAFKDRLEAQMKAPPVADRASVLEAMLIDKGILTKGEIDAAVGAANVS